MMSCTISRAADCSGTADLSWQPMVTPIVHRGHLSHPPTIWQKKVGHCLKVSFCRFLTLQLCVFVPLSSLTSPTMSGVQGRSWAGCSRHCEHGVQKCFLPAKLVPSIMGRTNSNPLKNCLIQLSANLFSSQFVLFCGLSYIKKSHSSKQLIIARTQHDMYSVILSSNRVRSMLEYSTKSMTTDLLNGGKNGLHNVILDKPWYAVYQEHWELEF